MQKLFVFIAFMFLVGCMDRSNEITSYGIVENTVIETLETSDLLAGEKHIIETWNIIEETNRVPNRLGVDFGISYKLNEYSDQDEITVEEVIVFPGSGLTNPSTGVTARMDAEFLEISPREEQYLSYAFDHSWEVMSGTWIFQVKKNGVILLEKRFHVE